MSPHGRRQPAYRFQRLTEGQSAAVRQLLAVGVSPKALASEYDVSVRTIHRIRHRAAQPMLSVAVGEWRARFAITDEGPVQVEPWRLS